MRFYTEYRRTEFPTEHSKILYIQYKREFERLKVLGENNLTVKRKGVWRKFNCPESNAFDLDDLLIQKYGIHPLEVQLLARAEENRMKEINSYDYHPSKSLFRINRTARISIEEINLIRNEYDFIQRDWSELNVKLLDKFYEDDIKYIDTRDFQFILKDQGSAFPFMFGTWYVSSKIWTRTRNDVISTSDDVFGSFSVSKNEALYFSSQMINNAAEKRRVPINPMDLDC